MSTKTNMTPAMAAEKIISLLGEVKREGIDNLINFIRSSDYLNEATCYGHHKGQYGLMFHSLEVLDVMLREADAAMPRESLILIALCHDLGKAKVNGNKVGGGFHPYRSLYILKKNGVRLNEFEREAIGFHHPRGLKQYAAYATNPYLRLLSKGACRSTHIDKKGGKYSFCVL